MQTMSGCSQDHVQHLLIVTAVFGVAEVVSTLGRLASCRAADGSLTANPTPDPDIGWTTGAYLLPMTGPAPAGP